MSQVLKKSEVMACQQIPSEAELLQRARDLIPMLLEKATSVEKNRMVSKETIQAFVDAGFFKILQPARFGGWEMNPSVFYKVLMELGRGCCSSAWNMMILGIHQWEFGSMPEQACLDVWGADDRTIIASSYPPFGKVEEVEGGYRISGTWKTSSGCDHGQWAFLGGLRKDADGKVIDRLSMLVSADDYEIIDDWHTFGLAGTGSKSLLVKDAFVPYHRAHSLIKYEYSERGNHYLYPFNQVFFGAVSSLIVGMAQGGVDEYIRQMSVRTNTTDGNSAALSPYVKDRLGNAVVRVRTARARLLQMMAESTEIVERRELVPTFERVHYMLDIARVGRECEEAVMLLFKATSARGIYLDNPLQRILRDVIAAANHITQNADDTAGMLGAYLLGQQLPPMIFGLEPVSIND
ncbi:3-hydroxy-9,10-secoandrosta-1,3,5(10)-triene-9,17-dione monooxygenase [Geopseudomonas sagittaria]|uniref:3-hydroxy-9,10-secoandrosta-1,3,5(10)-triene-9,17-dione monooxygenase n=1 Tax=Geopseudomonas sagittaria TaxID=1135990 RepID=A0A1I5R443_9GAMM|nr:acyl-CoA dehydrogenase family protein [Pseudomonas sagittaria]SFP53283.1 3-hydroxy-9,10-secoandrosta-1,3,5(10)-triene-9,17-dione monooxygenase [Pseudomonas sagittaria]